MATTAPSSIASNSILLVNPPSPSGLTANREGAGGLGAWSAGEQGFLYPPQTLAYCGAIMRAQGWSVRLLDAAGERLGTEAAVQRVTQQPSSVVAVQVANLSLDNDIAFLNILRAAAPHARLLALGAGMSFAAPIVLERTDADHVIIGEPEAMLPPVSLALAGEGRRHLRRSVTAADVAAPRAGTDGRVADLDDLPFPAWDLVPLERYGFLTIFASRGCDDTCAFCPYVVGQGRWYRGRQPTLILNEMEWLSATFHPSRVIVRDPVFAHDRGHVEQICQGLIARGIRLAWECESRPEHFDLDLLRLLKRAGCTTIKLGFETTSESVLSSLCRIPSSGNADAYMQQTAAIVSTCHSLGMSCHLFVMTGLPGQTDADVAETVAFLRRVEPTATHVKAFHRYPGLPMPAADLDGERGRGDRQAAGLQQAVDQLKRPAARFSVRATLRRLRKRIKP